MIQLTLTLKMTTAQVVKTSVTVSNNCPIQDYVHPDEQTQPTFELLPLCTPHVTISTQSKDLENCDLEIQDLETKSFPA